MCSGKTTLAFNYAYNCARRGDSVVFLCRKDKMRGAPPLRPPRTTGGATLLPHVLRRIAVKYQTTAVMSVLCCNNRLTLASADTWRMTESCDSTLAQSMHLTSLLLSSLLMIMTPSFVGNIAVAAISCQLLLTHTRVHCLQEHNACPAGV